MLNDEKPNSEFPTGDIETFLGEMNQPKQDMGISQEGVLNNSTFAEPLPEPSPEKPDDDKVELDGFTTQAAAEILVGIVDTALPAGLAALAHGKAADFQAEKEQKATLTKATKKYLDAKGIDLPPGWMLLFLFITVYGVKVPTAFSMRKEYKEENERQKTIDAQAAQIATLKKQIADMQKVKEETETNTEKTKTE